jgi:hypothetical protein
VRRAHVLSTPIDPLRHRHPLIEGQVHERCRAPWGHFAGAYATTRPHGWGRADPPAALAPHPRRRAGLRTARRDSRSALLRTAPRHPSGSAGGSYGSSRHDAPSTGGEPDHGTGFDQPCCASATNPRALRAGLSDAPDDLLTFELGPTVGRETPETTHTPDGDDR